MMRPNPPQLAVCLASGMMRSNWKQNTKRPKNNKNQSRPVVFQATGLFKKSLPYGGKRGKTTMSKKTPTRWQGYTWADCDCKLCLYYGGKSKGSVKCLAGDCVCKEERADALIRDQSERPIKYAYIYFKENMKPGSSRPRKDKIAIELEPTFQKLSFYDMKKESPDSVFRCWYHNRYNELLQILRDWLNAGIDASTVERFETPKGWDDWRKTVFFEDKDVHWQVLIEYNNGTCAAYVHRNVLFPKELRQIYELARSMNPGK